MSGARRRLPIGGQDFEDLRKSGFVYVDKTQYVAELVSGSKYYFLSRPRRFGKSLFLSTLKAYFEGKKECFKGLSLEKWEEEQAVLDEREAWQEYPVLHLDLNAEKFLSVQDLETHINSFLVKAEKIYGHDAEDISFSQRFDGVLRHAYEKTQKQVVVLIDEYDKPLLLTLEEGLEELNNEYRKILKGFFAVLKSGTPYLRFVFITGVSRFSKVSLFSDMNHLNDISLDTTFSAICGITEKELHDNFRPEIEALAEAKHLSHEETLARLKQRYDGYLFIENGDHVYNPFSLLNAFFKKDFRDYWFQSGTPTFVIHYLKKAHYYLPDLENNVEMDMSSLSTYRADASSPIPILFQAGYLTIKSYDPELDLYLLGYPNDEVKYGFIANLLPSYTTLFIDDCRPLVARFYKDVQAGKVDAFMEAISNFLEGIPYSSESKEDVKWREQNYQIAVALLFQLMGFYIQTEVHSAKGRADCVVYAQNIIYVFEFKLWSTGTAEEALAQIQTQEYYQPLRLQGKKLFLIGTSFDEEKRNIREWKALEVAPID